MKKVYLKHECQMIINSLRAPWWTTAGHFDDTTTNAPYVTLPSVMLAT